MIVLYNMTDNNIKIFCFDNNDFVEIPETYYSTDSDDITFIKNKIFFKIQIPDNFIIGSKRKTDDYIYIDDDESCKRIKTLEEDNKNLVEKHEKLKYSSQILKDKICCAEKRINYLKNELLQARVNIENNAKEMARMIKVCNKLCRK